MEKRPGGKARRTLVSATLRFQTHAQIRVKLPKLNDPALTLVGSLYKRGRALDAVVLGTDGAVPAICSAQRVDRNSKMRVILRNTNTRSVIFGAGMNRVAGAARRAA